MRARSQDRWMAKPNAGVPEPLHAPRGGPPDNGFHREASIALFCPALTRHMAKPKTFRETHTENRIVSVAKRLFHQQGVHATHVDEIAQAAGISPREFHRSFRNKHELAQEVVLTYLAEIESGSSRLHPKLASWSDFDRSLAKHVTFLNEFNMLRGCPLAIIGNELTEKDDLVRQAVMVYRIGSPKNRPAGEVLT